MFEPTTGERAVGNQPLQPSKKGFVEEIRNILVIEGKNDYWGIELWINTGKIYEINLTTREIADLKDKLNKLLKI